MHTETKVETVGPCRQRVLIEVPAARVDEELERAYARAERTAAIPGFRRGKAPRRVIELHHGSEIRADIKRNLVAGSFMEALKRNGIEPAVAPSVNVVGLDLSPGQPFRFAVEVEVWPDLKVSGYAGIKLTKKKIEVRDEDVDGYIRMILDRHAEFTPVEGRGLEEGDFALLDIRGLAGGAVFDEKKGAWIKTGPEAYCPGFCGNLYGAKPGETRDFTLVLPAEGIREELRGREASFTVAVREIKSKRVPELTDDFCKGLGAYANVGEMRASVRKDLLECAEAEAREDLIQQINEYLLGRHTVPLPPTRVAINATSLAEETAARLLGQGVKKEDILDRKEELMATSRRETEKRLALRCIYAQIARRERIEVSPDEVEKRVGAIAGRLMRDPAEVKASLEKEDALDAVREGIVRDKVEAFLLDKAKVKESKE